MAPPLDRHGKGFGVYIHWPFCLAKCPYCDFNSHVSRDVDQSAWREALLAEMAHMHSLSPGEKAGTIFFGGGTPSLMPPATVAALIERVDALWGLEPAAEITLEANPTSVEAEKFGAYAKAGVNRVSMGVQALNDPDLKALGRMHSAAEARAAFDIARQVFDRVSFDLIYARMGQTLAAWEAELTEALRMAVDHLSLYQLTIEAGTRFAELFDRGRLSVPEDDLSADMFDLTQELTGAAGMPAYEISNHARPGAESRHNRLYWRGGAYAGIGPGAHGRLRIGAGFRATETERDPKRWMVEVGARGHGMGFDATLSGPERAEEYLIMSLRLHEGASLRYFAKLNRLPLSSQRIDTLTEQGFLIREGDRIAATGAGRLVLNRLLTELLA